MRTAQSAQEKDDFSAGASVHVARFPIVGGKASSANRTAQRLRPRNNKNSFSRFLVKLDTITTLQYKKASGCPAGNRTTTPGAFAFLLECHCQVYPAIHGQATPSALRYLPSAQALDSRRPATAISTLSPTSVRAISPALM